MEGPINFSVPLAAQTGDEEVSELEASAWFPEDALEVEDTSTWFPEDALEDPGYRPMLTGENVEDFFFRSKSPVPFRSKNSTLSTSTRTVGSLRESPARVMVRLSVSVSQ